MSDYENKLTTIVYLYLVSYAFWNKICIQAECRELPISCTFWLKAFDGSGFVPIEVSTSDGINIYKLVKLISGLFSEDSNFFSEVRRFFGYTNPNIFKGIRITYNGLDFEVTKDFSTPVSIYATWESAWYDAVEAHYRQEEALSKKANND